MCLIAFFQNGVDFFQNGIDFLKNLGAFFSWEADFWNFADADGYLVAPVAFPVARTTEENAPENGFISGSYTRW